MQLSPKLPLPFLIVIVAGAASLFSIVSDRGSRHDAADNHSVQMQTAEQEQIAAVYFRVLSWLSNIAPPSSAPAVQVQSQRKPAPQLVKHLHRVANCAGIELCSLRIRLHSRHLERHPQPDCAISDQPHNQGIAVSAD